MDHLGELFDETGGLAWAASHHVWGELRTLWKRAANDDRQAVALAAGAEDEAPYPARDAGFCPIRFQGQWADPETGLYYNRFRHYDPLAGQYASPDPIGLLGGVRPQGYVHNPNAWVDPLGLAPKPLPAGRSLKIQSIDMNIRIVSERRGKRTSGTLERTIDILALGMEESTGLHLHERH